MARSFAAFFCTALAASVAAQEPRVLAAGPIQCADLQDGPCRAADTFDMFFDAGKRPILVMNFGIIMAGSAPSTTVCEEAFGGRTPDQVAVTPSGAILVPSRHGIFRGSRGDPCTWSLARGLPADTFVHQAVVDPNDPARVWALVGSGNTRALYASHDEGLTFTLRHQFPSGQVWWRLLVTAGVPSRIHVAGPGSVGPFALAVSSDGGERFEVRDPVPDLADAARTSILLGVSPDATGRLFFARDTPQGGDEVWISRDGGMRVEKAAFALPPGHIVGGFTFGATPQTVWVGGRALLLSSGAEDASLFVSRDGGDTWEAVPPAGTMGPRFRCLRWSDDALYACGGGGDVGDAFYLGRSSDGRLWEPLITQQGLNAPPACLRTACRETSAWLCDTYGACGADLGDAGAGDAGTKESSSGCGCQVGKAVRSRAGGNVVALWAMLSIGHWRRRTRKLAA